MSLSSSLISAVSGLQTAQRQIDITSGNVSNANVEGYSRQRASAVTNVTAGQNGGVDLGQLRREVDSYLNGEVRQAGTELGALEAKSEFAQRLTQLFGTLDGDSTLANGLNELSAALEQLALEPESASVHSDVVEAADALTRQLNRFSRETTGLRVEADREIARGVDAVNSALSRIGELNDEIARAVALDKPTANLEDERDRQLDTLSQWVDVKTFERSTGEMVVVGFTDDATTAGTIERNASTLVDSTAVQFDYTPANQLGPDGGEGFPEKTGDPDTILNSSVGGKLGALFETRDETLPGFHSDVDRLTQALRDRVNAAHNQGTVGNAGQATIAGTTNVTGDTSLTVASSSGPAEITVNRIGTDGTVIGSHSVDLSGLNTPAAIASQIDGAHADISASVVGGNLEISAAGTTAGLTVDSGNVTIDGAYTSGPGLPPRNFSHYFGLNNLFETPGTETAIAEAGDITGVAGDIQVRSDIKADPERLSRGAARSTPGEQAVAAGDGAVARSLADAFEESRTVLASPGDGNLPKTDTTLAGFAGDLLSFHAGSAERLESARSFQKDLRDELEFRADSKSGVNIDEELSNMVLFERSYNASARVISTVQEMFDTLDRMIR